MGRMKKKKATKKEGNAKKKRIRQTAESSDDELFMGDLEGSDLNDEVDQFHASKDKLKIDIDKFSDSGSENELMPFDDDSDDDDGDEDEIDGEEDETAGADYNLPQSWGKSKKNYYNSEYVGEDWGGLTKEDEVDIAKMEEQEARAIQRRLAEELESDDLGFDFLGADTVPKNEEQSKGKVEKIQIDTSGMTAAQKLGLLKKESPELLPLVDDFKTKMQELIEQVEPLFKQLNQGQITNDVIANYASIKRNVTSVYCLNISFYLMLKSERFNTNTHPVMSRIAQFGKLLKMFGAYDEQMKSKIENGQIETKPTALVPFTKKRASANKVKHLNKEVEENSEQDRDDVEMENEEMGDEKRGITYEMATNKGLKPYRKKENRNPRVKHRMKFKRALVKRKGQVRQPRNEMKKYDGEVSGIRSGAIKSVKFK